MDTVQINISGAEVVEWHAAIGRAIATGDIDRVVFRDMLAEVRNAAAADGIDLVPTLLRYV